jgi:hypothetical protein
MLSSESREGADKIAGVECGLQRLSRLSARFLSSTDERWREVMSKLTGPQVRPSERGAITIKAALILVLLFAAGFTVLKLAPAYIQQTEIVHKVNELARIAAVRSWKEDKINQEIKRIRAEYELPENAITLVGRDNGVQITIGYQRDIDLFVTNYTWRVDQTAIGKDM